MILKSWKEKRGTDNAHKFKHKILIGIDLYLIWVYTKIKQQPITKEGS